MNLRDGFETHKELITDRLDPDFGLLDELMVSRSLTRSEVAKVKAVCDLYGRSEKLLEYVSDKGIYQQLLDAIKNTQQTHLVNFISSKGVRCADFGDDWPLTEQEIAVFDTNQRTLVDLLETSDLLNYLYSFKVVNRRQRDFVSSKMTSHEKNEALLEILRRASLHNYKKTIHCLHLSKQSHIARIFEEGGAVVRVRLELETESDVNMVEDELITKITELLGDHSLGDSARILECTQLRLIAAKKGSSIILYFFCKASTEVVSLQKMQTCGKLTNVVRKMFNEILSRPLVINLRTTLYEEDFSECDKDFRTTKILKTTKILEMELVNRYRRRLEHFTYNYRVFVSGSSSEIPASYFLTNPTDIDFMMYRANICAVPKDALPPQNFRGEVLTIEPEDLPAGYVRLGKTKFRSRSTPGNEDYQKHLETYEYDHPHGPAIKSDVGWSVLTFDNVYALQCPYWPPEAQEWRTRHRSHGWPSKDLIDQIVSDGCFLVGKSHPIYKDDDATQWRYSFSKAEMRLMSSWNDNQKYVYHVLRMMKSQFVKKDDDAKTGLCTYHLKTQMFWACEERPTEFWEESNLLSCICELLTQLEQRFAAGEFPNYFLSDCNIIEDSLSEEDRVRLKEGITMLNTDIGRMALSLVLPPKDCQECRFSVSFPAKLALYIYLFMERYGIPFLSHRPKLDIVQQLIDEELDGLINGIYNMKLAKASGDSYYAAAEQHFWKGVACPETASSNSEVKRLKVSNRISTNAIKSAYESLENAELSTSMKERNKWDLSLSTSCMKCQSPYSGFLKNVPWNEESEIFDNKWLNPSHLITAAYLCNFYYMSGNYDKCIEVVGQKHHLSHDAFNTELFPMIFWPELVSLFDETLQEVLGLIWLCKHLSGGEATFEFCTCPHLFLLYIRVLSSLRLGENDLIEKAIISFKGHRDKCKFKFHLYSYHHVPLEMACRICTKSNGVSFDNYTEL